MHTTKLRRVRALTRAFVPTLAAMALVASISPANAHPSLDTTTRTWAPAATATIHPGAQTRSPSGGCTANFVFVDSTDVYLGQAAHCTGTGGATDTNGCAAGSLPLGTKVDVSGASRQATLVYSSWSTMKARKEKDANACRFNDFALLRLDTRDHSRVNPSVPFWGGPKRLGTQAGTGEDVYSYGNSSLRLGIRALSPKTGLNLFNGGRGWTSDVYTATPGILGDSGSGFMDSSGEAIGVLVTLQIAPLAASNGVTNLRKALEYANTHTSLSVTLANGTEAFSPLL